MYFILLYRVYANIQYWTILYTSVRLSNVLLTIFFTVQYCTSQNCTTYYFTVLFVPSNMRDLIPSAKSKLSQQVITRTLDTSLHVILQQHNVPRIAGAL